MNYHFKVIKQVLKPKKVIAAAKSLQSCPTLCDPIDGLLPGSSIPGILQERTLEWVAISFSSAWRWKVKVKLLSRVQLFVTPWTAAYQAPPSMWFSRQEDWSGVPLPSPRELLNFIKLFSRPIEMFMFIFQPIDVIYSFGIIYMHSYNNPQIFRVFKYNLN